MTLGDAQRNFTYDIGKLIEYAYSIDYEFTFGDGYRDPRAFGVQGKPGPYGRSRSAHKNRLAVDFNLFKDRKWLRNSDDYKKLGDYWKSLDEQNVWGGDFIDKRGKSRDGNHFSRRHWDIS